MKLLTWRRVKTSTAAMAIASMAYSRQLRLGYNPIIPRILSH